MRPQQADLCLGPQTHCLQSRFTSPFYGLVWLKKENMHLRMVQRKTLVQYVQGGE